MEGNNARQNDDGWDHQFEKGAQQNPFLPFSQILGSQRFLHNRLVRTPENMLEMIRPVNKVENGTSESSAPMELNLAGLLVYTSTMPVHTLPSPT
ncbi:hypothetical protein PCI56_10740 [Plesiomonas shigelloides subsp. oncorhynchi]|nr:hypothetical protein [Plesiomonas shigelloides]